MDGLLERFERFFGFVCDTQNEHYCRVIDTIVRDLGHVELQVKVAFRRHAKLAGAFSYASGERQSKWNIAGYFSSPTSRRTARRRAENLFWLSDEQWIEPHSSIQRVKKIGEQIHVLSNSVSQSQSTRNMNALDSVRLTALMELSIGRPEIVIGLIDGPVAKDHPELRIDRIREAPGKLSSACARTDSVACQHGTFVAGILSAKRNSSAPAICPDCTLLVRPIFSEATDANGNMPSAKPEELAAAIIDCVNAGAHVLNISAAIAQRSSNSERTLKEVLDEAAIGRVEDWRAGRPRDRATFPVPARQSRHNPS